MAAAAVAAAAASFLTNPAHHVSPCVYAILSNAQAPLVNLRVDGCFLCWSMDFPLLVDACNAELGLAAAMRAAALGQLHAKLSAAVAALVLAWLFGSLSLCAATKRVCR